MLAEITGTQTTTYLYGLTRLFQQTATGTEYFIDDGLGSGREPADAGGKLALVRSYNPFGQRLSSSGSGASNYRVIKR